MSRSFLSSNFEPAVNSLLVRYAVRKREFSAGANTGLPAKNLLDILETHQPIDVSDVAAEIRAVIGTKLYHADWWGYGKRNAALRAIIDTYGDQGFVFALTTSHSGWVRQQAVNSVQAVHGPFTLAMLLLRLNDWVPAVRAAALAKVEALYNSDSAPFNAAVLACSGLLLDIMKFGRTGPDEKALIVRLLSRPALRRGLFAEILDSRLDDAPRQLMMALRIGVIDEYMVELATKARHPRTRVIALQAVLFRQVIWREKGHPQRRELLVNDDIDDLVEMSLDDPSTPILSKALSYVISTQNSPARTIDRLKPFALHRSRSVSDAAIFGLKQLGFGIRDWILAGLKTPGTRDIAANALVRHGLREDGALLFDLWQVEGAEGLLHAAAFGGESRAVDALLEILLSSTDLVATRRAAKSLFRLGHGIPFAEFEARLFPGSDIVARGLMRFIPRLSAVQIAVMLLALKSTDAEVCERRMLSLIAQKRNRGSFSPNADDVVRLQTYAAGNRDLAGKVEVILGVY